MREHRFIRKQPSDMKPRKSKRRTENVEWPNIELQNTDSDKTPNVQNNDIL